MMMAMSFIVSSALTMPALAQVKHDDFAHNTPKAPPQKGAGTKEDKPLLGAMAIDSPRTPVVSWFESFDTTVFTLKASDADRALLNRPFDREAERLQQWIDTAHRVAKNYRLLAATIKRKDVPSSAPDIKQYRDLKADWYGDVAGIYEDLIRPRRPPKTQEELEGQIQDIKQRALGLEAERMRLKEMDDQLRNTYKVHAPRETDALTQYITTR
jgi:hypothetical protein